MEQHQSRMLEDDNADRSHNNFRRESLSDASDCQTCRAYAKEWFKSWSKFRKRYAQAAKTKSHILGVDHDG